MATNEVTSAGENRDEKAGTNLPAENLKEKVTSSTDHPDSQKSSVKWPTMKQIQAQWNFIFVTSCVLAVFLDPLFLYIPILDEDMKCLKLDNNLKITALVLRSVTDLFYIANFIVQVYRHKNSSTPTPPAHIATTIWKLCIIINDIIAILPLPQVVILIFFSKMRASTSFSTRRVMNFLVIVQYVTRVLRIYLSCKQPKKQFKGKNQEVAIWIKAVLNFILYILASHVLGAFWYFFAIQRMTTCWQSACRNENNGCDRSIFDCHDHHSLRNITSINDLCPINQPNTTLLDFGIFLDVIQSGILGSTNYPLKFSNSFCWGLRNLSSFASNLQPSANTWEILFVASISIIGLLLFVYLIGNLQTYLQFDTSRLELHRHQRRIERKMKKKDGEVELWLSENGTPLHKKSEIMEMVRQGLEEEWDFDVDQDILSILSPELRDYIERCKPLSRLKEVQILQDMNVQVLIEISTLLKPMKYTNKIIINEDQRLEMMLFIVDGLVTVEKRDCSRKIQLGAGQLYGEKLLIWPSWTSFHDESPLATETVRAFGDVEALVLLASDMMSIGSKFKSHFNELEITRQTDSQWELLTIDSVTMLQTVPKLRTMDTLVLKEMSKHLVRVKYGYQSHHGGIVRECQPLSMMFFVVSGNVIDNDEYERNFFGEELLDWVLDKSFPAILPLSTSTARVVSESAKVLILTAENLKIVATNFMSHFSKEITSQLDLSTFVLLTRLKKVEIFKKMDEQVLKAISERLKPITYYYAKNSYIIQKDQPLEMMFFVVRGVVSIESVSSIRDGPLFCETGGFYGEELVHWVKTWESHNSFPANLPLSTGSALCSTSTHDGPVEILALRADDLKRVLHNFRSHFTMQITFPTDSQWEPLTRLTILKNVEMLNAMDEGVLKVICEHLEPEKYEDQSIIPENERLKKMFFIMSGVVSVSNEYWTHYRSEGERPNYGGDELIDYWVRSKNTGFPAVLPMSRFCFRAIGEVEVLVLKADDLAKVQPRNEY